MKEILMYQTLLFSKGIGLERFKDGELKELDNGQKYIVNNEQNKS